MGTDERLHHPGYPTALLGCYAVTIVTTTMLYSID